MSMWKENDIVTIFGNPVKLTYPIGQARLVKKISDDTSENTQILEQWQVEFLDDEGRTYNQFIRKNGKN